MPEPGRNEKRRHMRFPPDKVEVAYIEFTDQDRDSATFQANAAGLVMEEAYGGCGLVVLSTLAPADVQEGAPCQVRVGRIGPIRAEIRWVKALDDDVAKVGLEYLDDA